MTMAGTEEYKLYESVRRSICRGIFDGTYQDGDFIPPERKLSEDLGVSRVTVRKALDLLAEERIICREQGRGTKVSLYYGPRRHDLDIITVVAPAHNAFFANFMGAFQTEAEKSDSLVLYKQKPKGMPLEDCLYKLYEKGIHNVVLWLEDMEIREEALRILRGLGMNLVLFDCPAATPYADSVCIDNRHAIESLYAYLRACGCGKVAYVGWDQPNVGNIRAREAFFRTFAPEGLVCRIPWKYAGSASVPSAVSEELRARLEGCDGVLYSLGELGIALERNFQAQGAAHRAATMDYYSGADELKMASLEQDFAAMTEIILRRFREQNQTEKDAEPTVYYVQGKVRRE